MWAFSEESSAGSVTTQKRSKRPTFSFPLSLYTGALRTRISPWLRPCAPRSRTFSSTVLVKTVRVLRPSLSLWSSLPLGEADDTAPRTPIMPSAMPTTKTTTVLLNTTFLYSSSLKRGGTLGSKARHVGQQGLEYEGMRGQAHPPMSGCWCCLGVACHYELPRMGLRRTSENSVMAKFA